jgi:hypothetical protein
MKVYSSPRFVLPHCGRDYPPHREIPTRLIHCLLGSFQPIGPAEKDRGMELIPYLYELLGGNNQKSNYTFLGLDQAVLKYFIS